MLPFALRALELDQREELPRRPRLTSSSWKSDRQAVRAAIYAGLIASGCSTQSLGPFCTQYLGENGCCVELAAGNPMGEQACRDAATDPSSFSAQAEETCQQGIENAKRLGFCTGDSRADAGADSVACRAYLRCVQAVDPATYTTVSASLGPGGQCWKSTITEPTCEKTCADGLEQLRSLAPDEPQCFQCDAMTACPSGRPICAAGLCVECSVPADCGSGHTCVSGHCLTATGGSCATGAECATSRCYSGHCCQPQTCSALGRVCGSPSDGCGSTLSCGQCTQGGACSTAACTTAGTCQYTPIADFAFCQACLSNSCACLANQCRSVKATCSVERSNLAGPYTYTDATGDHLVSYCICNGTTLEAHYSNSIGYSATCSACGSTRTATEFVDVCIN